MLSSIYREDIRSGFIKIYYNGTVEDYIRIDKKDFWCGEYGHRLFIEENELEVLTISGLDVVPVNAFYGCRSLKYLTIEDATVIGDYAFTYCELKNVRLSSTIKTINYMAFAVDYKTVDWNSSAYFKAFDCVYLKSNGNDCYVLIEGDYPALTNYVLVQEKERK